MSIDWKDVNKELPEDRTEVLFAYAITRFCTEDINIKEPYNRIYYSTGIVWNHSNTGAETDITLSHLNVRGDSIFLNRNGRWIKENCKTVAHTVNYVLTHWAYIDEPKEKQDD